MTLTDFVGTLVKKIPAGAAAGVTAYWVHKKASNVAITSLASVGSFAIVDKMCQYAWRFVDPPVRLPDKQISSLPGENSSNEIVPTPTLTSQENVKPTTTNEVGNNVINIPNNKKNEGSSPFGSVGAI